MILKKTRSLRFNLGHYEHVELFATAEVDTIADRDDLARHHGLDTNDHDSVMDFITDALDEMVRPEVEMAHETSDLEDSFVFPYVERYTTTNKK